MNQRMNPDEAIDRVLTGLATTETASDMEQRVLKAVQARVAAHHRTPFALPSMLTFSRPWAIAAALVLLSLAASLAVRRRHEPMYADAVLKQHPSPQAAPVPQVAKAQPVPTSRPSTSSPSWNKKESAPPEDINDLDTLAIVEMNAPSRPAPPLPLTHQEKLLAEAVHQDGTTKLSSLRPEVRDRQMELSKAEFRDFFEPPPAKDNE